MRHYLSFSTCAAIVFLSASSTGAVTLDVTTDFINANVDVNGTTNGAGSPPSAFATATDTVTSFGVTDTITGTAIQNENGFSSLELTVESDGFEGFASTGQDGAVNNRATAIRQITFTNNTSFATVGTFSFSLSGIELETYRVGGGADSEAKVSFAVGATNGSTFDAEMTLRGTLPNSGPLHEIVSASNFGGSVVTSECVSASSCYKGTVNVTPLSDSITLGVIAPGDSVSVTTTFDIETSFSRNENGAQARAIDPSTYSWTFAPVGGPQPAPIPVPAGAWLMLSGLGAIAVLRRRKRA